jgi:hypothetical protein
MVMAKIRWTIYSLIRPWLQGIFDKIISRAKVPSRKGEKFIEMQVLVYAFPLRLGGLARVFLDFELRILKWW